MKYVLVSGGVVSGLGKGVTASSIGVILKHCGHRVTSIKIGTRGKLVRCCCTRGWPDAERAPQIHTSILMRAPCRLSSTERCLCLMTAARCVPASVASWRLGAGYQRLWRLGAQVDLDLGNYERFLDVTLTRDNNLTTGKVYQVLPVGSGPSSSAATRPGADGVYCAAGRDRARAARRLPRQNCASGAARH